MRTKTIALVFSALLPLSVFAAPDTSNKQVQQEQRMQERQSALFESLELNVKQREAFKKEMQRHHEKQRADRKAHHDKLRELLTPKQQAHFDKKIEMMQKNMHKKQKMHRQGKSSRADCKDK
ncbi:MAG: hypothetical protein RBR45_01985 [Pseudomonas sp.]|jgi:Spy/CpxP family protein refolding chaperone|nr:hypothetical protein [Pseudomonas sp.]